MTRDMRPRYVYQLPDGRFVNVILDHGEMPKPVVTYSRGGGQFVTARLYSKCPRYPEMAL